MRHMCYGIHNSKFADQHGHSSQLLAEAQRRCIFRRSLGTTPKRTNWVQIHSKTCHNRIQTYLSSPHMSQENIHQTFHVTMLRNLHDLRRNLQVCAAINCHSSLCSVECMLHVVQSAHSSSPEHFLLRDFPRPSISNTPLSNNRTISVLLPS